MPTYPYPYPIPYPIPTPIPNPYPTLGLTPTCLCLFYSNFSCSNLNDWSIWWCMGWGRYFGHWWMNEWIYWISIFLSIKIKICEYCWWKIWQNVNICRFILKYAIRILLMQNLTKSEYLLILIYCMKQVIEI